VSSQFDFDFSLRERTRRKQSLWRRKMCFYWRS